jgi:hypothetical protein
MILFIGALVLGTGVLAVSVSASSGSHARSAGGGFDAIWAFNRA